MFSDRHRGDVNVNVPTGYEGFHDFMHCGDASLMVLILNFELLAGVLGGGSVRGASASLPKPLVSIEMI